MDQRATFIRPRNELHFADTNAEIRLCMKNSGPLAAARSIANPDEIFGLTGPADFLWHLSNDKRQ
jgi:hypothetical protein